MTDRELLELAAKAAGIELNWFYEPIDEAESDSGWFASIAKTRRVWNPLTDDGDALRLAVKLGLAITPYPIYEPVKHSVVVELKRHAECPKAEPPFRFCQRCTTDPCQLKPQIAYSQSLDSDPCAATRRAIVRAAAEIGKQMEKS